jgi:hypothetical protein
MFSRYYMGGSEVMGDSQSPVVSVHEVMVLDILG